MAYQIQYGQTAMHITFDKGDKKKNSQWFRVLIPMMLTLFIVYLLNNSRIQELLIPGDKAVTKAAWAQMNQSLEEGTPFTDAFRAFCRDIVQDGDVA